MTTSTSLRWFLVVLILGAAFAFGRIAWVCITRPSQARVLSVIAGPNETLDELDCQPPTLVRRDLAWMVCQDLAVKGTWVARFDFSDGSVRLGDPLEGRPDWPLTAAALNADGRIALALGFPDRPHYFVINPDGTSRHLGRPNTRFAWLRGLFWVEGRVAAVLDSAGRTSVAMETDAGWQVRRLLDKSQHPEVGQLLRAEHGTTGWKLTFHAASDFPPNACNAPGPLFAAYPDGTLNQLHGDARLDPYVRNPTGILHDALQCPSGVPHPPGLEPAAGRVRLNFQLEHGRITALPRWDDERIWQAVLDGWLSWPSLSEVGLQRSFFAAEASEGHWLADRTGAYVRVDAAGERDDGLNVFERMRRALLRADESALTLLQKAALVVWAAALPLVTVAYAWRLRARRNATTWWIAVLALLVLTLALAGAASFWSATALL